MAKDKKKKIAKKLGIKNTFTFIIAFVIIAVAVVWYFYQNKQVENAYSKLDEIFTGNNLTESKSGEMTIHIIDVGQGDCIFVEFPDEKSMLIDSGDRGNDDIIVEYLDNLGVKEITLVIATHTDTDHIGCMQTVFEEYSVEYCLRPFVYYNGDNAENFEQSFNVASSIPGSYKCKTQTYYNFLNSIVNEGCGHSYFNRYTDFSQSVSLNSAIYKYSVDFLTPVADFSDISYSDSNDYSPIFILSYANFDMMFTGDAGEVGEEEMLAGYPNIPEIEVLKVGHHGSKYSTIESFADKIAPKDSIFSCGVANSYGHPAQIVIDRLYATGSIWRTDLQGNIVITVSANGDYDIQTERFASLTDIITGVQ